MLTIDHGPLPDVYEEPFAEFWAGTRRGALLLPECVSCGRKRWPPRPMCPSCHGVEFGWKAASARGRLHTWTVVHHQTMAGMPPPYVVGLIEIENAEGVKFVGNVMDLTPGDLRVDMGVEATFVKVSDDVTLVAWSPVRNAIRRRKGAPDAGSVDDRGR